MQPLTLAFLGSAPFSVPTLRALIDAGHRVVAVYTQPPRPAGRGQRLTPSPVHAFAESRGLAVRTPATLNSVEAQDAFAALGLDAGVVAAYGLILPEAILRAPRLGCLNVHASLLPRWRGAAPIERAILEGDPVTGVTIMQVARGLDTGPMLLSRQVPITATTTAAELHRHLAEVGAGLMIEALAGLAAGTLIPRPQPAEGVCYAKKLDRDEGRIDWTQPADRIARAVRALNPVPGVWFAVGEERVRVLAAEVAAVEGPPGTILDHGLTVACGEGALRLHTLQRAGKRALEAAEFLRGFPLPPGTVLG